MATTLGLQGALSTPSNLSGNIGADGQLAGQLSIAAYEKSYLWIKWCETEPNAESVLLDTPAPYIGIYASNYSYASTNYEDYTWYNYKGLVGDSAYQAWLNQGNTGTESDFVLSLKAYGYNFVNTLADLPAIGEVTILYYVRSENCIYAYVNNVYRIVQNSALTNLLAVIQLNGDGTKVLADNGTYVTLHQTDNNYTLLEKNKLAGIEDGAQPNKIEKIIYNGIEVPITDKTIYLDEVYQVHQYTNSDYFPNIGQATWIYLDQEHGTTWRWDDNALVYYITGADYSKINLISGGNAYA